MVYLGCSGKGKKVGAYTLYLCTWFSKCTAGLDVFRQAATGIGGVSILSHLHLPILPLFNYNFVAYIFVHIFFNISI